MALLNDYLDFLVCIMFADGSILEEEAEMLTDILEKTGLQEEIVQQYQSIVCGKSPYPNSVDVITRIVNNRNKTEIMYIVRDAFLMADSDGDIHSNEKQLITSLFSELGFNPEKQDAIWNWGSNYINNTKLGMRLFQ